ncbi:MAG: aromatic ring-hydroxylating dioxygenase subunit alpha [SAR86 cluster bacterium]|jgi:phenylpropionate dioxygenase-like ring-hydroxylating dioxygenase large terminal subunit|nr:aromatic ring-hydroxylating dioxygenase subunit alpha [SAR86 cluster bacterium]
MNQNVKDKDTVKKAGDARSPYKSYTEYLDEDSQKVPAFMVEENFEFLGSEDISADRYISEEYFKAEAECMWTRVWQFACRVEDIPKVGDSLVYDILNWSFIIVRTEEDKIQAFYNSCLHRGRKLKTHRTHSMDLKCPFHGYCWNLDGSLKHTPASWDFPHVKDDEWNLPEVRVEIWEGFVFINMDDNAISLEKYLEPLPEHHKRWNLGNCKKVIHVSKVVPGNWKTVQEAFMESFHATEIHPEIMPFTTDENARYDIYGDHMNRNIALTGKPSPHCWEVDEQEILDTIFYGSGRVDADDKVLIKEGEEARKVAAQTMRDNYHQRDGHDYSDKSDAEMLDAIVYNVFPNFSPWGGFANNLIYRFRPNGTRVDSAIMEAFFLERNSADPDAEDNYEPLPIHHLTEDQNWTDAEELTGIGVIFDQDMSNIPEVEAGLRTSKKGAVTYANYQESRLRHYHQTIDKYIAKGPLKF